MKAHSLDLRQRIIDTYENEPISQRQIAARFRVAQSVVTRLIKQYRETGELSSKPRPGRPRSLNSDQGQVVKDWVSATPDITLGELCRVLKEQTGVSVSESTMCREMKRLNLTSKKKAFTPATKLVNECKPDDMTTGMR